LLTHSLTHTQTTHTHTHKQHTYTHKNLLFPGYGRKQAKNDDVFHITSVDNNCPNKLKKLNNLTGWVKQQLSI